MRSICAKFLLPHCGGNCKAANESCHVGDDKVAATLAQLDQTKLTHMTSSQSSQQQPISRGLARRLGLFDATMIVMGGIVGAGIFINPYVVAQQVHTPALILFAWVCGGIIAMAGAFIYAELASRLPAVGGQYAYMRDAFHPGIAFLYGWALLLVIQTGGMAAVAITFGHYFSELTRVPLSSGALAALALGILTLINCLGVRAGSSVQSALMVMKIVIIAALVGCAAFWGGTSHAAWTPLLDQPVSVSLVAAFGAAMVPVMFSYGGYQTANFIAGEMREPRKNLPRGLVLGVAGVVALYVSVNYVCVRVLGATSLAETRTPASAVMRMALGQRGAMWIALGIAISALGFLSQSILTAPRVYFAMAEDGVFFRSVAWLSPRTRVPVVAIALQGIWAIVIALSGRYEQILNFVISMDLVFIGLTATSIFVFRRREAQGRMPPAGNAVFHTPGHPFTTIAFAAVCWLVVATTFYHYPKPSIIGLGIMLTGLPVYLFWGARRDLKSTRLEDSDREEGENG
jgi:APA family basic amino acid/polyamine antiporter